MHFDYESAKTVEQLRKNNNKVNRILEMIFRIQCFYNAAIDHKKKNKRMHCIA